MNGRQYYQKLQKSNFIELKTLEYYLGGKEKAQNIFDLRHKLTPRGFEVYTKYYLKNLGYKMKNFMGGNKADGGIDLQGKYKDFEVFVQCKKYIKNSTYKGKVGVGALRNFYGGVVSEFNGNISDKKVFMLFVTTGHYSFAAKEFAKKHSIKIIDYKYLAQKSTSYNIEQFKKDYTNLSKRGSYEKLLNKKYLSMSTPIVQYSFDDLRETDIFTYLKNVRSHIVDDILKINEIKTDSEVFKDGLLHQLAYRKINSYSGIQSFHKQYGDKINQLDKAHLVNFSSEIIRGLEVLKKV